MILQNPVPGSAKVMFCGDLVTFTLEMPEKVKGDAWIRTELGRAEVLRREIIRWIDHNEIKLNKQWHDIKMDQKSDTLFSITLPLTQTGHFNSKCFFLPRDSAVPVWPPGDNCVINVEPAGTCCANIIYNAFVRQFGGTHNDTPESLMETLDKKGYTVIPESGKFRDLIKKADFIFSTLGCRAVQLLPVHPVPTTYGRMGRFGSPYAAVNFKDVDPALAEFDPSATPLEQFRELADTIHRYNGYLFLDIAINHTGWAASIHESHPEWLVRGKDGRIEVPGAWGVEWADLTRLDYSRTDLWQYMAEVFLLWCSRGVDGFRCDAGYMIPVDAWEYITARVKEQYPDTLFLLEGLGGPLRTTCDLLNRANMNWAYSELFQNYDKYQIEHYLTEAFDISKQYGIMINFAETHDNPRLASVSREYAVMRTALSALFSFCGGFGFANGVEWFAEEKINVHESPCLNWDSDINQVDHIRRLNLILKCHPCFYDETEISFVPDIQGNCVAILRCHLPTGKRLMAAANLSLDQAFSKQKVLVKPLEVRAEQNVLYDLITGRTIEMFGSGTNAFVEVAPGEVLALSADKSDVDMLKKNDALESRMPDRAAWQKYRHLALKIFTVFNGFGNSDHFDILEGAEFLSSNPVEFIRSMGPGSKESQTIVWQWPKDVNRVVMVPPGFFLVVFAESGFRAKLVEKTRDAQIVIEINEALRVNQASCFSLDPLPGSGEKGRQRQTVAEKESGADGGFCGKKKFFAVFMPREPEDFHRTRYLIIQAFEPEGVREENASLLYLAQPGAPAFNFEISRDQILADPDLKLLGTNTRGAMMRSAAWWSTLPSKYDGLIAANLSENHPEDRRMLLSRLRIWAVYQGYSRALDLDCLEKIVFGYENRGRWDFHIPTCDGSNFLITIFLHMDRHANAIEMKLVRRTSDNRDAFLSGEKKVTLIIRPDIEDRSFHETVKAYTGPEHSWRKSVTCHDTGFVFQPEKDRRCLSVRIDRGSFVWEPEWQYMVEHPVEKQRGLDFASDLFSPGYFEIFLGGNDSLVIRAAAHTDAESLKEWERQTSVFTEPGLSLIKAGPGGSETGPGEREADAGGIETDLNLLKTDSREKTKVKHFGEAALASLDAFIINRGAYKSVIAGYPWFLDWGRDSLIFCRSLIEADRCDDAKDILRLFGRFEKNGTLPNMICGDNADNRETSDAPLWFAVCVSELVKKESDAFLDEIIDSRRVRDILMSMVHSLVSGTETGVVMDRDTCCLYSPSHFTWMDTNFPAGSPRQGYPVEIQALWHHALSFAADIDPGSAEKWQTMAATLSKSVRELFFIEDKGFFSDCLHCTSPVPASKAEPDDALRPNQLFVITLGAVTDASVCIQAVECCSALLVPGAVRSLDDEKLNVPLVIEHDHKMLKDPHYPYSGTYEGDETMQRKPAYHNGTAWTWPFPVFCEAYADVFGSRGKAAALAWLGSSSILMERGCLGFVPEILDGDAPHRERGCDAQAWGSSELARVWLKLMRR